MTMIDLVMVGVIIFMFSITLLFSSYFLIQLGENSNIKGTIAETHINKTRDVMFTFDDWFPFIFIGLVGAVVVGAFFIRTHPIFFVVSVIILFFYILLSGIIVNMFDAFARRTEFAPFIDEFGSMVATWNNFPYLILISGAVVLIVLYSKYWGGGNAGV